MPSLGAGELIVIFVLVLVLFGPNRLPELARGLGKGMREIRKVTSEFQSQLAAITDLDDEEKPKPTTATAALPPAVTPRLDQIQWTPHEGLLPADTPVTQEIARPEPLDSAADFTAPRDADEAAPESPRSSTPHV